jgi:membrane-associated protease RseP (regulator of RpoE activity)
MKMKILVWLSLLVAVAMGGPGSPVPANAAEGPALRTQQAVLDTPPTANSSMSDQLPSRADASSSAMGAVPSSPAVSASAGFTATSSSQSRAPSTPLTGSITKTGHGNTDPTSSAKDGNGFGQLYGSEDDKKKWKFFTSVHKGKMSADDYRALQFGITGFVSVSIPFGRHAVVTQLYPGCPAQAAGMRVGDKLIRANDHEFTSKDRQAEFWRILDGRAGTTVQITLLRKGELIAIPLIRMNIEDIPDRNIRRMFEHLVKRLGTPGV